MPFIVIEGTDGSGKATQAKLLVEALEKSGHACEAYAFPAYASNVGGQLLARLLSDENADFANADPRLASLPYSIDRYESSHDIRRALVSGKVVVSDRFIGSNQIHQGGKLGTDRERHEYLDWLDHLEHGVLHVPRPDLIIYLKVPVEVSLKMLADKRASKGGVLADGEMDQVEKDRQYLMNSHRMANWLARELETWRVIDCIDAAGNMRSREDIHADALREAMELL